MKGFNERTVHLIALVMIACYIFVNFQQAEATRRMLEGDQWINQRLLLESLPRGNIPKSNGSPCTSISGGKGRGRCTLMLGEMNVAGGEHHLPFSDWVMKVAPASASRESTEATSQHMDLSSYQPH